MTSVATSIRPAALILGARRKPTSTVFSGRRAGIDLGFAHQGAQSEADRTAQLGESQGDEDAVFAQQRNRVGNRCDGQHLEERRQDLRSGALAIPRFQQSLRELEGDACAAEMAATIIAAGLIGVQHGESVRNAEFSLGQMVIGDDQVKAEFRSGFSGGEGANAGVDADHEANAFARGGFENFALHAVTFAEAMRNVKACDCRRAAR